MKPNAGYTTHLHTEKKYSAAAYYSLKVNDKERESLGRQIRVSPSAGASAG